MVATFLNCIINFCVKLLTVCFILALLLRTYLFIVAFGINKVSALLRWNVPGWLVDGTILLQECVKAFVGYGASVDGTLELIHCHLGNLVSPVQTMHQTPIGDGSVSTAHFLFVTSRYVL